MIYLLLATLDAWLAAGYHLRDCHGAAICTWGDLLAVLEAGRGLGQLPPPLHRKLEVIYAA